MATVSSLGIIFDTQNGGLKTVTATPAVGDLIVLVGHNTVWTGVEMPTDDNADGLGTYTTVQSNTRVASGYTSRVWIRNALIGSATSTTWSHDIVNTATGGGFAVLKVTPMQSVGAAAVRKAGGQNNQAAGGTPAPTWTGGGSSLDTNPIIGFVVVDSNPATMTEPTGFTELHDVGYSGGITGMEIVKVDSGQALSTVTWNSTAPGTASWCSTIVELDAFVQPSDAAETIQSSVSGMRW